MVIIRLQGTAWSYLHNQRSKHKQCYHSKMSKCVCEVECRVEADKQMTRTQTLMDCVSDNSREAEQTGKEGGEDK